MKTGMRMLAVVVSLAMLVTGPLAPTAVAQQPTPTPPPVVPGAEQPTAPPQPATQQPAPQPGQMMQDAVRKDPRESESAAYDVGAAIANVVYVPGKGVLCFLGGAVGVFVLLISFGSQPKTAAYFAREGCGGKWFLTGDDLRPDPVSTFDWERDNSK